MINEPRNINPQCGAQDNIVTFLASLKKLCVIRQEIIIFHIAITEFFMIKFIFICKIKYNSCAKSDLVLRLSRADN